MGAGGCIQSRKLSFLKSIRIEAGQQVELRVVNQELDPGNTKVEYISVIVTFKYPITLPGVIVVCQQIPPKLYYQLSANRLVAMHVTCNIVLNEIFLFVPSSSIRWDLHALI